MKRTLIVLVLGLLSVGCLTPEQKQKALRDSVVGEYERKADGKTYKQVFLENGIVEYHHTGKNQGEAKWTIVDGEIHVKGGPLGWMQVYRINPDDSITSIAGIFDGKRFDIPKGKAFIYKKIK